MSVKPYKMSQLESQPQQHLPNPTTTRPIRMRQWILLEVLAIVLGSTQQTASAVLFPESESGLSPRTFPNDQPSKIFCQFNKKEYSPGDIWYPSAPVRSSSAPICIRCICLNTGRLNCTQEACPSNCNESNDPCCKTCSVIPNPTLTRSDIILPPPQLTATQVEGDPGGGSSSELLEEDGGDDDLEENVSCLHQGKIYRDREVFTANVSGLPIASIDQCMQCQCQTGMVLCAMKACSTFKCSLVDLAGSKGNGDSCCQRCTVWNSRTSGTSSGGGGVGSSFNLQTSGDEIIQSRVLSNHVIKDASQQQQRIGGIGPPESLLPPRYPISRQPQQSLPQETLKLPMSHPKGSPSNSMDSTVTFRDTKSVLSNGKPTQKPGDDCISSGIFYLHGSTWHPTIGPFGPMECVTCKCQHGQVDCDRLKCPGKRELPCGKPVKVEGHCCPVCTSPSDKVFEAGTAFCVSAKQDITAFKSFGVGQNETEYIEFAFLRPRRLSGSSVAQVERHEWKLLGLDIEEFTTQYLTLAQFESLRNRQAFTLLGATNEKNVEKFTRREKKLEKRCTSRCNVRISGLERSLRLHKLISRSQCLGHERMVHTV